MDRYWIILFDFLIRQNITFLSGLITINFIRDNFVLETLKECCKSSILSFFLFNSDSKVLTLLFKFLFSSFNFLFTFFEFSNCDEIVVWISLF